MGRGRANRNRGFTLVEVIVGAATLVFVALAATSGFNILDKSKRQITTRAELRDLMNEIRPLLINPKLCRFEMSSVLAGIQPQGLPSPPAAGQQIGLKRIEHDSSGNLILGTEFVGHDLAYGQLKNTQVTLVKKAQTASNAYQLTLTLTAKRGTAQGNSFGSDSLTDTFDFSVQTDSNGNLMNCSGAGTITTVNAVPDSVCNLMPPDSLGLDPQNQAVPPYFFWDTNAQSCVFTYNMIPHPGDKHTSGVCAPGEVFLKCDVANGGAAPNPPPPGNCTTNTFSHSGQTRQACIQPYSATYNSSAGNCQCSYSTNSGYISTNSEQCEIVCGTRKSF